MNSGDRLIATRSATANNLSRRKIAVNQRFIKTVGATISGQQCLANTRKYD
jgi:hypothetical protein